MTGRLKCPCGKHHSKKVIFTGGTVAQLELATGRVYIYPGLPEFIITQPVPAAISWDNHDWHDWRGSVVQATVGGGQGAGDVGAVRGRLGSWRV